MQEIQPEIEEIKKKYKDNKEEQGKALMQLYKDKKVNPFSSCLPLLIQLPFLIAVFRVFRSGVEENLNLVYPFLSDFQPETINYIAFGFLNLEEPNIVIAVLAGGAQFWQAKMMLNKKKKAKKKIEESAEKTENKTEGMAEIMSRQMLYFMPVITIVIGSQLPGGLTLYWLVVTLLTGLQQVYVFKKNKKKEEVSKI